MKRTAVFFLCFALMMFSTVSSFALEPHQLKAEKIENIHVNYVEIDIKNKDIETDIITAKDKLTYTESFESLTKRSGAFAVINGTYFDAYKYITYPVGYQIIIKDGKVLRNSSNKPVFGFKKDGTAVMDLLSIQFTAYRDEKIWCYPWRINYPSTEDSAITIYTPEYGSEVIVPEGAKAAITKDGIVTKIATSNFKVPENGFAVMVNKEKDGSNLIDTRIKIGDRLYNEIRFLTNHTDVEDWEEVETAVGAGPSLIINGKITANPAAEDFTEEKILTMATPRSFIGVTKDGIVKIGNVDHATIAETAEICKKIGLYNAMCLDGGGSVALYHNGKIVTQPGRELNNVLGFRIHKAPSGGEMLYKYKFIGGASKDKMVLNEESPLTREQLAAIILELNGLKDAAEAKNLGVSFEDSHSIAKWAKKYIGYCVETKLMVGVGNNRFSPKTIVKGKMLGAVVLRALGYKDEKEVKWSQVEDKLRELGIPIENKELTRGEAFDYIWKAITKPICTDGGVLGVKLGKLKPGDLEP